MGVEIEIALGERFSEDGGSDGSSDSTTVNFGSLVVWESTEDDTFIIGGVWWIVLEEL